MAENYIKYRNIITSVSMFVAVMSVIVMIGWINHIDILTTVFPGYASMKFNTAFSFLLITVALICAVIYKKLYLICQFLAIIIFTLGALSFIQHLVNLNFDISRVIFQHDDDAEGNHFHVFVMAPQTALCISFMGAALLWVRAHGKRYRQISQYLLHIVSIMAFIVLLGYLYKVPHLHQFLFVSSMAVPTAVGFFIISLVASLLNPSLGFTGVFTGNMIGNLMARRLFFPIVAGVLTVGYLRMLSYKMDFLQVELGIALMVVVFVFIALVMILAVSNILNKAHLKLETAKENFSSVVESAPNALIMSDVNGKIALVNAQAKKIFGYESDNLIGKSLEVLVPERFRGAHSQKQPHYFKNPGPRHFSSGLDLYALHRNGTEFPVEISLTPIITLSGTVALASIVDITVRKANEALIQKQLIELQSKNQELEQFNYISSHDLQEPLRTVLNYIRLLEEDYPELSDEVKSHLQMMEASVIRMSTVVKSLLDFGRLGRNKKLALTDCKALISDVLSDLNRIIKDSGAIIIIDEGHPLIYAYETELRQLFQNLINNAIKFRKKDIVPIVKISCRKIDGFYEFSVSDNGIGISQKYFERVFDIFQRLNKDTEFEGHGIGLANCKKIAEMHGGKIWVESELGKGSTFIFTILNFKP